MGGAFFAMRLSASAKAPAEAVYELLADLKQHLVWAGERAPKKSFRLLTLEAPDGAASVGTEFSSTGADSSGRFEDRSMVTEATAPRVFAFETDSRLARKKGEPLESHIVHRYELAPNGSGTTISYSISIERVNYLPYWLKPWFQPLSKMMVGSMGKKHLENLARMAEERSGVDS